MAETAVEYLARQDPPIVLKRSARARRVSLRISTLDRRVTLTLPKGVKETEAIKFAADKSGWIRTQLLKLPDRQPVSTAMSLPFEGEELPILSADTKTAKRSPDQNCLLVPKAPERRAKALETFYKHHARDRLAAASDHFSGALGKTYTRLTIRDTRSRWGSCSPDGGLMYSWRLTMAPRVVLEYVAAHEVAHLRHMHHQPAFWDVVQDLCPDFQIHRKWLRENGAALHRWDFKN